jgi:hypothetical protein
MEYEQTLLIKPQCFAYKIPLRSNTRGYRAQDWDLTTWIWSGRLVITAKGELCTVRLEDESGQVFAQCPVRNPSVVEAVTDSSRYFVIRVEDGPRHAFLGIGFTDRSDAFDFNVAISDHHK